MTSLLRGVVDWLDGSTEGLNDESNLQQVESEDTISLPPTSRESDVISADVTGKENLDCNERTGSSNTAAMKEDLMEVSMKAVHTAKEWGGYLMNLGKMTGGQVTKTAGFIKSALDVQTLFSDEAGQSSGNGEEGCDKYSRSKSPETVVAPWVNCEDAESMKSQILALSQDKQNFLCSPPAGVEFSFDYAVSYPLAQLMLEHDPHLKAMRFELVPKQIREQAFWQNYFYRLWVIKQSSRPMSSVPTDDAAAADKNADKSTERKVLDKLKTDQLSFGGELSDWNPAEEPDLDDFEVVMAADLESTAG